MPLAEEDLAQIKSMLSEMLPEFGKDLLDKANAGITKRVGDTERKLAEAHKKALDASLEQFRTQFSPPTPPNKDAPSDQLSVQLKTFEARLNESNAKLEEAERRARIATEKNRRESMRRTTAEALAKVGVKDPVRNGIAAGYLIDSKRQIAWDSEDEESARLVYRDDRGEALELETGLKAWAKTDEAKHFLDASGMRGSGSSPGGGQSGKAPSREEVLARAVFEGLPKG